MYFTAYLISGTVISYVLLDYLHFVRPKLLHPNNSHTVKSVLFVICFHALNTVSSTYGAIRLRAKEFERTGFKLNVW